MKLIKLARIWYHSRRGNYHFNRYMEYGEGWGCFKVERLDPPCLCNACDRFRSHKRATDKHAMRLEQALES